MPGLSGTLNQNCPIGGEADSQSPRRERPQGTYSRGPTVTRGVAKSRISVGRPTLFLLTHEPFSLNSSQYQVRGIKIVSEPVSDRINRAPESAGPSPLLRRVFAFDPGKPAWLKVDCREFLATTFDLRVALFLPQDQKEG